MRASTDLPRPSRRLTQRTRVVVVAIVVLAILLLTSVRGLAGFYTDYLWFDSVHFATVFRGILFTRILLALVFAVAFFALLFLNLTIVERVSPKFIQLGDDDELVQRYRDTLKPHSRWVRIITSLIFGLVAGVGTNSEWNNWLLFRNSTSWHIKDPEFHKDISFYVFKLPFINFVLGWLFAGIIVIVLVSLVSHYLNGGVRIQPTGERVTPQVKAHISVLLGALALVKAVQYYFAQFNIVLATGHVVEGGTYTEVHANLPADRILIAIGLIAAGLFLYNIREKGWLIPGIAVALWVLVWALAGVIYPAAIQALKVDPSENVREAPYIDRNIAATRDAYGLDNVQVDSFSGNQNLTASAVTGKSPTDKAAAATLANIRLLDPDFVQNAFSRLQELRGYYTFPDLDVDRYVIHNELTETLLAVRQLNASNAPPGFINQRLQYTHGYGAALAPANQEGVMANGQPDFSLSDIPPAGTPKLTTPDIYFGENLNGYVIAHSKQPELDYQDAAGNTVTTSYDGTGGVKLGSLLRRAAFALRFGDINPLISGQVDSDSRIMWVRNINQMVRKAAPFLRYDADPYATILDGKVYWVIDAYTTTNRYPYSQQFNGTDLAGNGGLANTNFNYVRNSVKVVIDAYNGSMRFYVTDPDDPIIRTYEKIFPKLFTPLADANRYDPGFLDHLRYPEDLFRVQTDMYGRYHLTTTNAFYTQANSWSISQDPGSGSPGSVATTSSTNASGVITTSLKPMAPLYLLGSLPGGTEQNFLLLRPFVPLATRSQQKQNLTGFMVAESDPSDYGKLILYRTQPGVAVEGPALINSVISSDQAISQEITFLNQQGSRVRLGNVVMVPIDNSLIYVQPLYVQSLNNPLPKLGDVLVVYNGTAYHSGNASLDGALCKLPFGHSYCNTAAAQRASSVTTPGQTGTGGSSSTTTTTTTTTVPNSGSAGTVAPANGSVKAILSAAQTDFAAASHALKAGNLAGYQADIQAAEALVAKAEKATAQATPRTTTATTTGGTSSA
jgi:uncharacterized membrane protein (UPF0182 family)